MSWKRLRDVFRPSARDEVDAEIDFHLQERTRELISAGVDPAQARQLAVERFGPAEPIEAAMIRSTERRRAGRQRAESISNLVQDVRYAARQLRRAPGFAAVAILTIALGIGATTSIYSVVNAALIRTLPWPHADQIVVPQSINVGTDDRWNVTYRDFLTWQDDSAFARVALHQEGNFDLTGRCGASACDPERVIFAMITPEFFQVLGIRPLIGRLPQPDEFVPNSNRAVVISFGLWQRRYGGDPSVVGQSIQMTGFPATIVGVLPPGTEYPRYAEAWYPYRAPITANTLEPDNAIFNGIARLRDDRTLEQTRLRLASLAQAVSAEFPQKRENMSVTATPVRDILVDRPVRRGLWVLLGAVGLVLVIACVNVANLMLVRATARERELSLRVALGSGRWRIVSQLLTESLVLAAAGGLLAIGIGAGLARLLVSLAPPELALVAGEVDLNLPTLAVAAGATLVSAILFGIAPALRASGVRPAQALAASGGRTAGGRRHRRTASALVVVEVALSLTLLAGAGLLARSLMRLRDVDTGLDLQRTLTFQVALPQSRFDTQAKVAAFWEEYLRRLRQISGVAAASVTTALPLGGGGFYLGRTMIEMGRPEPPAGTEIDIMWTEVGTQYFASVGQPLVAGRDFEEREDTSATPRIIVSREFARRMWPDQPPELAVGKTVFSWRDERLARQIVGVAGDVRFEGATDAPRPLVWVPVRQSPRSFGSVIIRSAARPDGAAAVSAAELLRAARRELASLDGGIALARVQTMEEVLAASIAPQRFNTMLFGSFAVLALLLAVIGLYGVLSYTVARETREIGVRMALGSSPAGVRALVLRRTLMLAGAGAVVGLGGAFAMTRALQSLLFQVQPNDPLTLAVVTAILLGVAACAGWIPARRATKVDPAMALRAE
jgi:predicted permease